MFQQLKIIILIFERAFPILETYAEKPAFKIEFYSVLCTDDHGVDIGKRHEIILTFLCPYLHPIRIAMELEILGEQHIALLSSRL